MTNLEYLVANDKELWKKIVKRDIDEWCECCAYYKPGEKCMRLECDLGVTQWLLCERKEKK